MEKENNSSTNKRQVKDSKITGEMISLNTDYHLWLIHKKTEKLTTAIYMVTDFFDVHEPLRIGLRSKSLSQLSFISAFGDYRGQDGKQLLSQIMRDTSEILSLLELATNINLLSQMNFSIFREEYKMLKDLIQVRFERSHMLPEFIFPEQFFFTKPRKKRDLRFFRFP